MHRAFGSDRPPALPVDGGGLAVAVRDPEIRVQQIHGGGMPPLHLLRGFLVRLRPELILYNRVVMHGQAVERTASGGRAIPTSV